MGSRRYPLRCGTPGGRCVACDSVMRDKSDLEYGVGNPGPDVGPCWDAESERDHNDQVRSGEMGVRRETWRGWGREE
jgi:hypothetical protein